jgi:hypothetical protein
MNERGLTVGQLTRKPQTMAAREYVAEIARILDLDDDAAERVADYVLAEIEREGTCRAELMFPAAGENAGCGPFCSWCGAISGMCYHIAGGGAAAEQAAAAAAALPPTVPADEGGAA